MRTTLNIDDSMMAELLKRTHEKSKTRAVTIAIENFLKKKQIEDILSYQGNLEIEDNWRQLEDEELGEYAGKR
ncbi:MAG: type II toxin-antitoxin system VapB family antitoxin [Gammaproteobacteria bacterium]|nr:type II toxin-antitoxin system VapB family antitoxin [Gammaproteobacteria bacterium]